MMYVVRGAKDEGRYVYVTVEPVLVMEPEIDPNQFPVTFAWTHALGEAVRFSTCWHAAAIVNALPGGGTIIRVKS